MPYPQFQPSYLSEELAEIFSLDSAELSFVRGARGNANRHGVAILLKSAQHLGYFPNARVVVPESIRIFIGRQLGLSGDCSKDYLWNSTTHERHLDSLRLFLGLRAVTESDKQALEAWLCEQGAISAHTSERLFELACAHCREMRIELPSERELLRLTNSALKRFYDELHHDIESRLPKTIRTRLRGLLFLRRGESTTGFDRLKADPGHVTMETVETATTRLRELRALAVPADAFRGIPFKLLDTLRRRAMNEKASEMRVHAAPIRLSLLAVLVYFRSTETTDDLTKLTIEMIQAISRRSTKQAERQLLEQYNSTVDHKLDILVRMAEASLGSPEGKVKDVIFPVVSEEELRAIQREPGQKKTAVRLLKQELMRRKYARHYRRMLPLLLEALSFESSPERQPIIDALAAIKDNLDGRARHYADEVPIKGVVTKGWKEQVLEEAEEETKVHRHFCELCALEQLQKGLKSKEVWVGGARLFRDPSEDLPANWDNAACRQAHYEKLGRPMDAHQYVTDLKARMEMALVEFNGRLPELPHLKIEKGLFRLNKLEALHEASHLEQIKSHIRIDYGMVDLLDILVEADRLVDFTRFFTHSGTKQVRTRDQLRPLILLALFAEGTNTGMTRVAGSNARYSAEELLYVRKTYLSPDALRNANSAVVNRILALRDPKVWGEGQMCASDGKKFGSWSQNLMTQWRSRYQGRGVLIYWHVETGAVCVYSQLRSFSDSEVAAMIQGLVRHETEARIERNYVDSHGQSEVAFAFCDLLGNIRLMPRLKRIKKERLYLPDHSCRGLLKNLTDVIARPIQWSQVTEQYDEMIRSAVALKDGTAPAEAVLRRFNSYNTTHPTYKALAEVGKAVKTIFLCNYLGSRDLQHEVQNGLQMVERWNSVNDFICYGNRGEFATNSREQQEITTLSLQLLQNSLMLVNTLLVERTVHRYRLLPKLTPDDRRAITPLFYAHVNPYGHFELHLDAPSLLQAA